MVTPEIATLGGGCFWCLEAVFERMRGVLAVESGYMGGHVPQPSYKLVCTGTSGHAEVVQVAFDPAVVTFRDILTVFFAIHDPTTLDRQGNDVGPQYRSAIFYHTAEQKRIAGETIAELQKSGEVGGTIVTEVTEASDFWKAEAYHQGYFRGNGAQPYCQYVVAPKVKKFLTKFAAHAK